MEQSWLVEDCMSIDISTWHRYAMPHHFTDRDSNKRTETKVAGVKNKLRDEEVETKCAFVEKEKKLVIITTVTDEKGKQREHTDITSLDRTPCNFGGKRLWALCPACNRRTGKLYKPPGEIRFLCRKCYGLIYRSSRESGNRQKKLERRISHLSAKLGETDAAYALAPVPPKPKSMHDTTYIKIASALLKTKLQYEVWDTRQINKLARTLKKPELAQLSWSKNRGLFVASLLRDVPSHTFTFLFDVARRHYNDSDSATC